MISNYIEQLRTIKNNSEAENIAGKKNIKS